MIYLSVMIGGGLGSLLRFLISSFGFLPFATVFINIVGSFILGFLTFFFLDRPEVPPDLRFGLTAGFCGGFTTFSTFSVEVYAMVLDNHIGQAAFYVLASFLGGLLAVALGAFLAKNCWRVFGQPLRQTFTKNDFEALKRVSFSFVFSGKAWYSGSPTFFRCIFLVISSLLFSKTSRFSLYFS